MGPRRNTPSHSLSRSRRWFLGVSGAAMLLACAGLEDAVTAVPVPENKKNFVGKWEGVGVSLTITPDGGLAYEKTGGVGSKSLNAPIQAWGPGWFEAGIGPLKTRFVVNKPPKKKRGTWHMTIDGTELKRVL